MGTARYAVRFKPPNQGQRVPLATFVDVMRELEPSLRSLRAAAAPHIATDVGCTRQQVSDALDFRVGPPVTGSLVIPLDATGGILHAARAEDLFWSYAGNALLGKQSKMQVPTVAVEHLVQAIDTAKKVGISLEFARKVGRGQADWRTTVALTKNETTIRERAARAAIGSETASQIVGHLVGLQFHPGRLTVECVGKRISIEMPAELRSTARAAWGAHVVVDVVGVVTADGEVREPRARAIRAVASTENSVKGLLSSFGSQRDVWGTKAASEYLEGLRKSQGH